MDWKTVDLCGSSSYASHEKVRRVVRDRQRYAVVSRTASFAWAREMRVHLVPLSGCSMISISPQRLLDIVKQDSGQTSTAVTTACNQISVMFQHGMPGTVQPNAAKLAYIVALNSALRKASSQNHFNLETAINDLWIKLEAVRTLQKQADSNLFASTVSIQKELADALAGLFR